MPPPHPPSQPAWIGDDRITPYGFRLDHALRGEADINAGRTTPLAQVIADLRQRYLEENGDA
jgi:predicted transcriptional regulator